MILYSRIKTGGLFIHRDNVFIKTSARGQAVNLDSGHVEAFSPNVRVRHVEADITILED